MFESDEINNLGSRSSSYIVAFKTGKLHKQNVNIYILRTYHKFSKLRK